MSDKEQHHQLLSNSVLSPAESLQNSRNQWLEVPDRRFSSKNSEKDAHSVADRDREDFAEEDDPSNMRKATTSNIKEVGVSKPVPNKNNSSSGHTTSIKTGTSQAGAFSQTKSQLNINEKKQRFKVNPATSFNLDDDVKSDAIILSGEQNVLPLHIPQDQNNSSPVSQKDKQIERQKASFIELKSSSADADSYSEDSDARMAARRIAAILKGEKPLETEAELENMQKKVHEEEEDRFPNYEEGIFIFRKHIDTFLGCQIPVGEEEYRRDYMQKKNFNSPSSRGQTETTEDTTFDEEQGWAIGTKIVVNDARSLYLFHHTGSFRRLMVNIIENKWFDNFIILMIFLNSMGMAVYDYSDRDNICMRNRIIEQFSFFFTQVFNVEFIFKIIGMGFFMHKNSYLRLDVWNWLDFCVVIVGIIEILPIQSGSVNLKGLRTLRVLRPLKSIKSLPAMRKLIGSLGSSIGPLTNVVVFLLFVFLLFGILGVSQFEGQMYQRCRLTNFPVEQQNGEWIWPFDHEVDRLCSMDGSGRQCPIGQVCGTPRDRGLLISSDKPESQELINYGITTFDHLGNAFIVIFQMITLEGWVFMMYNLMDAGSPLAATAYCILLVIICAFFVLNVILAVLGDALQGQDTEESNPEDDKRLIDTDKSLRRARKQKQKQRGSQVSSNPFSPGSSSHKSSRSRSGKGKQVAQSPAHLSQVPTPKNSDQQEPFQDNPDEIDLSADRIYPQRSFSMRPPSQQKNPDFQTPDHDLDIQLDKIYDDIEVSSSKSEQPNQSETLEEYLPKNGEIQVKGKGQKSIFPVQLEEIREEQSDAVMSYSHAEHRSKNSGLFRSGSLTKNLQKKASTKVIPVDNTNQNEKNLQTTKQESDLTQKKNQPPKQKEPIKLISRYIDKTSPKSLDQSHLSPTFSGAATSEKSSKRDPSYLPSHAQRNILFKLNYQLCSHSFFDSFITFLIIMNTVVLAMDRQRVTDTEKMIYDFLNDIFTWAFVAEMIIKLLGLGFTEYIKDSFNKFDAVIVILSLVEFVLVNTGFGGNLGAFSALRGFRLLRVFKLARGWKQLRILLKAMAMSIIALSTFSVLMLIIIFIFMLLGMELFAFKIRYNEDDEPSVTGSSPRENFDTPWQAFITIFIVIVGDDWNTIMYSHYRVLMETSTTQGYVAVGFFICLFIMGNLVLLNLFLAILLQNFGDGSEGKDEDKEQDDDQIGLSIKERILTFLKSCCSSCGCCNKKDESEDEEMHSPSSLALSKINSDEQQKKSNIFGKLKALKIEIEDRANNINVMESEQANNNDSSRSQLLPQQMIEQKMKSKEPRSSTNEMKMAREKSLALKWDLDEDAESFQSDESEEIFADDNCPGNEQGVKRPKRSSTGSKSNQEDLKNVKSRNSRSMIRSNIIEQNKVDDLKVLSPQIKSSLAISLAEKMRKRLAQKIEENQKSQLSSKSGNKQSAIMEKLIRSKMQRKIQEQAVREEKLFRMKTTKSISMATIKKLELKTTFDSSKKEDFELEGNSLCMFGPQNSFRKSVSALIRNIHFDNAVLLLILVSTVLLCMEMPLADPKGEYVRVLGICDKVTTFLFILECVVKVVTYGYACNGKNSYMNSSWNIMDFIIVFFSIFDLLPTGQDIGALKIIRLARVLRPLRMIARNEGMKIAIESLIMSIKGVGNVLIISILILLLFAILGTNFYKGLFNTCSFGNVEQEQQQYVKTMWECFDAGGEWIQIPANFDNVCNSMITLFTAATTEGWVDVMKNAMDATKFNAMPVYNNNPMHALFFIMFVLIMALFILNLFVGVVINKFNEEKERLAHNTQLTPIQMEYCDTMIKCYSAKPKVVYQDTGNQCKDMLQKIASSKVFDNFIFGCIVTNTMCMAVAWYGQPQAYTDVMKKVNLAFAIIYTIECAIKLYVFRKEYFSDGWNKFDFVIVMAAWMGLFADLVLNLNIGAVTTIIRTFRIARIFKMIKRFKQLNKIFNTFISALPQLGNIGTLLCLMLLLYAVAGVFFFSHVKFGDAVTEHTNFTNWPNAMLTLFRCSTGEAFNEIMWGLAQERSIEFQCQKKQQTYEEIQESGGLPNGCGSSATATGFFMTFIVLVTFIFINMFIAIILEGFENSTKDQKMQINEEVIDSYIEAWSKYDPKGTGLLPAQMLDSLVMDLIMCEQEIKGPERKNARDQVLFNLSNDDYLLVYTKLQRQIDLDSKLVKDTTRGLFKTRLINRYWNKFCWEMCVPSYCSFTSYNFHDILVALVRNSFKLRHMSNFIEREKVIQLRQEKGIPLEKLDRLKEQDDEFLRLPEIKMEMFLEISNRDFNGVIDRLEQIKGMRDKDKIAKYEYMRKLRITQGLPYRDRLDEYGGYIFDSAHVRAAQVVMKYAIEKVERRKSVNMPNIESIDHTDSDFDVVEMQKSEGDMDNTTAKKIDYSNLDVELSKVTCRMPYSDEHGSELVQIQSFEQRQDVDDIVTGQSKTATSNYQKQIVAEENNLQTKMIQFTNTSITNARIIAKRQMSHSPSKIELDQTSMPSERNIDNLVHQKSVVSVLMQQDEEEIERVFQGFVAAADEKDKLSASSVVTAVPRVSRKVGMNPPFPYPLPVSGLDQEIEDKILQLISDDNLYSEHALNLTDEGEGGGLRAHDDSPLEIQLMTADVQSSIGSLTSLKQPINLADSVMYEEYERGQFQDSPVISKGKLGNGSGKKTTSPRLTTKFPKDKRLSMATANIQQSSPYAADQKRGKAASSYSPRDEWQVPSTKPQLQNYGTGSTGMLREQPVMHPRMSNHDQIIEIQKKEKYDLMFAQRKNGNNSRQNQINLNNFSALKKNSDSTKITGPSMFYQSAYPTQSHANSSKETAFALGSSYKQKPAPQESSFNRTLKDPNLYGGSPKRVLGPQFFGVQASYATKSGEKKISSTFRQSKEDELIVSIKYPSELRMGHYSSTLGGAQSIDSIQLDQRRLSMPGTLGKDPLQQRKGQTLQPKSQLGKYNA